MNELNKKLAEWVEFKKYMNEAYPDRVWDEWIYPDGKGWTRELNFTQSLDACFKWLVPKVNGVFHYDLDMGRHTWFVKQIGKEMCIGEAETPALALCRAIEKIIDGEKKC